MTTRPWRRVLTDLILVDHASRLSVISTSCPIYANTPDDVALWSRTAGSNASKQALC